MKKNTVIILIFVVILAIHAAVLCVFFRQNKAENAEEEAAAKAETAPEPGLPEVTEEELRLIIAKKKMKIPYNYSYAVRGNIAKLPASSTPAAGILVDVTSRNVLWAKNPQKTLPIASMTKVMTILLAYETILSSNGKITLDSPVKVSKAAYEIGGSQVYLDPKETFPMRDLMMAASIQSANDAAYLIAEYISNGDIQSFVNRMNAKARSLGMNNTHFYNPHGLPGDTAASDNSSSPEDMARIAEATMLYPLLMKWAGTWRAPFRDPVKDKERYIMMQNHNHLIPGANMACPGVTGLKTGFIRRAGYCLVATCTRGGRTMVAVVMNFDTWKNRDKFVASLFNWGYARAENPAEAALRDTGTR